CGDECPDEGSAIGASHWLLLPLSFLDCPSPHGDTRVTARDISEGAGNSQSSRVVFLQRRDNVYTRLCPAKKMPSQEKGRSRFRDRPCIERVIAASPAGVTLRRDYLPPKFLRTVTP
ncbi:MAG: hypothetical protein KJS95_09720, partial [Gammaproteobacteria bacterium]|nr:hypothetical protein [Gammaproteobacteria bacterium]